MNHLKTVMQPGTGRVAVIYDSEVGEMFLIKFYTIGQRPEPMVKDRVRIALKIATDWVQTGKLYPDEPVKGAAYPQGVRSMHGNWSAIP